MNKASRRGAWLVLLLLPLLALAVVMEGRDYRRARVEVGKIIPFVGVLEDGGQAAAKPI